MTGYHLDGVGDNIYLLDSPSQGIPVIYYGTEQELNGGNDPQNRESLWPHYDTHSEMYLVRHIVRHQLNMR